jgi:hypothetical protein
MVVSFSSRVAAGLALYSMDSHKLSHSEEGDANIAVVFSGTITFHSSRFKEIGLNVSSTNFKWL